MRLKSYTAASRSLFRLVPGITWRIKTTERRIYLTFDDGPFSETTPALLIALDRLAIRGSFFLIGNRAEKSPLLVREIAESGHAVGNHSFSHLDAWRVGRDAAIRDLEKADRVLAEILGRATDLVRPPYGHFRPATLAWAQDRGKRMVLWDTPSRDFVPAWRRSVQASNLFLPPARGSILVLHERPGNSSAWMHALMSRCEEIKKMGWTFATLQAGVGDPARII